MNKQWNGALSGLRVIDLSHALAGPFCTQVLADHGADVIKVEPPSGDFFRNTGPFLGVNEQREYGGIFASCNRNKRSIVLDLKHEEGRALLMDLIADADVLVENFRAGTMEKLGLGYEVLAERNPRLVYTSIRGFGDARGGKSPYVTWPAFDIVAQAMGGWMGITGPDPDTPTKVGGGAADTVSGLFAAFGTMAALWNAKSTGKGQYVDVAMVDSILALSELITSLYSFTGTSPVPSGNTLYGMAPFGTFKCKDGIIALTAPHQPQWAEFCRIIGRPELIDDPRFSTDLNRWNNREDVSKVVESFTSARTKEDLQQIFGGRIPFAPIFTAKDIFTDPHFKVRQMLPAVPYPGIEGTVNVPGVPVKLTKTPGEVRSRAPKLGEHTEDILQELGISTERIDLLKRSGAVGDQKNTGHQ